MTPDEFWRILHDAPEPRPIFYRLYHDEHGQPIAYSMEDRPGNYIEIDAETFARGSNNVRVVNGQLIKQDPDKFFAKLSPNHEHGTPCHPQDVCVVVSFEQPHMKWSL